MQEYTERYYIPAAAAYLKRAVEKGKSGAQMVDWQHTIHNKWANLRFGDVTVETNGEWHLFEAQV